jgi:hypothetical protein
MTTADGQVLGAQAVVDNGPSDLLLNIVLVAEGFQEGDLPEFARYAQQFADRLFSTAPFTEARCGINIFRVDVSSTHTGADDPVECGGSGTKPSTYFDASYCAWGIRRGISVDEGSVINVVRQFIPQWHLIIVLVNSQIWGGMGGQIAKSSVSPGWEDIAIHEMGHSLFGLADEYEYLQGCGIDTDHNEWPSFLGIRIEPGEPNITIWTDRNGLKWRDLVSASTAIPTTSNADCTVCDPQPSPVPAGTVGTFEGAGTYHCKVYRPEFNCMMRNFSSFCAVCSRTIRQTIDGYHRLAVSWAPLRFARINDYAGLNGFVGGFPNFHEADYGQGVVFGSVLLRPGAADWRDVPAADLGNPGDFEQRFRAVNDYAGANGYFGGYPNFHQADYGQGVVYGCILLRPGSADWRDVSAAELGNPTGIASRFTAVHDYAVANGYVGGYPNFHEADYGQGVVYGCLLIKSSAAEWRDVPIKALCARPRRLHDAQFVSQTVPQKMTAGESKAVTITMRNIGTGTWTPAGAHALGSQQPQDNTLWGLGRVSVPTTVTPGAAVNFHFNITAPGSAGTYRFQWRMLQEAVEWFGDFTLEVQIRVIPPGGPAMVPDVREMTPTSAANRIRAAGLEPAFTGASGTNTYVAGQSPKAGVVVDRGTTVTCNLRKGPIP